MVKKLEIQTISFFLIAQKYYISSLEGKVYYLEKLL